MRSRIPGLDTTIIYSGPQQPSATFFQNNATKKEEEKKRVIARRGDESIMHELKTVFGIRSSK